MCAAIDCINSGGHPCKRLRHSPRQLLQFGLRQQALCETSLIPDNDYAESRGLTLQFLR